MSGYPPSAIRHPLSALRYPLLLVGIVNAADAQAPADLVFRGGRIYTGNDRAPQAEAIAVRGDRIVFVGSAAGVARLIGGGTRVVELGQRIVVPGLADAHAHVMGIGARELRLNLEGVASIRDVRQRLSKRVRETPPGQWIVGRNWIETHWPERRFLTRQDLDAIAPVHPVWLTRSDGHASVANSAALRLASVTRATPDPFGGEILRDSGGEPTGMLIDRAQELVAGRIPPPDSASLDSALIAAAARSVRLGWTQLQDPGGEWDEVERMRRLYRSGRLSIRIYKALSGPGPAADSLLRRGPVLGEFGGRFTIRTIKVYLDGAVGSRGAALLQPYNDRPDTRGLLVTRLEQYRPMLREALRRGIQVETHAIGDSANRLLLNLYAEAFAAVPRSERKIRDPRWRDEHAQLLAAADIPRFAQLGVIPSMQASHAISDLHFAPSRLGAARLAGAYAWHSLRRTGVPIAGGSDAPVERGEPMVEFYAAVARRDTAGYQGPDWHPEQAVTRREALKMLTLWPAYAAFEEKQRGTIEPGKWADLTVLSADIMRVPVRDILTTRAVMTVIAGEVVAEE
ncbi:MAG TPA: amidohydrolase [Gemmatimonadales bacterium]|nr:amidohydrolase [Gemmatimonadales bacterium]